MHALLWTCQIERIDLQTMDRRLYNVKAKSHLTGKIPSSDDTVVQRSQLYDKTITRLTKENKWTEKSCIRTISCQ